MQRDNRLRADRSRHAETVRRGGAYRAMIDLQKIWTSPQLPTLPNVAVRLLELSKNPDLPTSDVVEVIKTDPAIVGKILKTANSSHFGFRSQIKSVEQAVPLLGRTAVTSLALSFSLAQDSIASGPTAEHYRNCWLQSAVQAATAELICERCGQGDKGEYFLAGLMADIGRLAMLKTITSDYVPILVEAARDERPLHEVESQRLGITHAEAGARLMQSWGFGASVIDAVSNSHASLNELRKAESLPWFDLVKAVSVASAAGEYFCTSNKASALQRLQTLTRTLYTFTDKALDELIATIRDRAHETSSVFAIDTGTLDDPSHLMAQANEQLARLAMREHAAVASAAAQQEAAAREMQALQDLTQRLQQEASHDPLTRIFNRRHFDEALATEIERCRQIAGSVGLVFFDVDRFKTLNDRYGHPFGDKVLEQIASTVRATLRPGDIFARYGGEEFVVLTPQPTERGMQKIAERLRAKVEVEPFLLDGKRVPVTVSVGAAIAMPQARQDNLRERLIAAADETMYEAKQAGRNQSRFRSLLREEDRRLLEMINKRRFSRWLVDRRFLDVESASRALARVDTPRTPIGQLAVRYGYLDGARVDQILQQQSEGERFGEVGLRLGFLTDDKLATLLARQQECPKSFASTLARLGVLPPTQIAELFRAYCAEIAVPAGERATVTA